MALALAAQEWPDWGRMGKREGRAAAAKRRRKDHHDIRWSAVYGQWRCVMCGRRAEGTKGMANRIIRKSACRGEDFFKGVGEGHSIMEGWIAGEWVVAFCTICGRQRAGPGRGLCGPCRGCPGQTTRMCRIREGRHPASGVGFDRVCRWEGRPGRDGKAEDGAAYPLPGGAAELGRAAVVGRGGLGGAAELAGGAGVGPAPVGALAAGGELVSELDLVHLDAWPGGCGGARASGGGLSDSEDDVFGFAGGGL